MPLIEGLKRRFNEFQKEIGSANLALLIAESLNSKRRTQAERVFIQRIGIAIKREEIQLIGSYPLNESEEPIAIRLGQFEAFEDRGYAVFLVIKKEWIKDTLKSEERSESLDILYNNLKTALEIIDAFRDKGYQVLTTAECEEIAQQQRLRKKMNLS